MKKWIPLLIIIALSLCVLFPTTQNEWTNWDDHDYVLNNEYVTNISWSKVASLFKPTTTVSGNYHPLTILSFSANHYFSQLNPHAYHWTNLIIHLLNCVLIYWLIFRLSSQTITAFSATLLFSIHPMNVEAIAWISSRKDLLFSFFYLAGLIMYIQYIKSMRPKDLVQTGLLFVLSLLCKAQALSFPLVLFALDYFYKRKCSRTLFFEKAPFILISLFFAYLMVTAQMAFSYQNQSSYYSFIERIMLISHSFSSYICKFIFPFEISNFYPYPKIVDGHLPIEYYIVPLILFFLVALIYKVSKHTPNKSLAILIFLIPTLFILKYKPFGAFVMADRYMYLPYIGLAYFVGIHIHHIFTSKNKMNSEIKVVTLITFFLYVGFLSYTSYGRAQVWKNNLTLWNDVIQKYPQLSLAYHQRALFFLEEGNKKEGLRDLNKAIDINPYFHEALNSRGIEYAIENLNHLAITDFSQAIMLKPHFFEAYNNRGRSYLGIQDQEAAFQDFEKAIAIAPHHIEPYINRARIFENRQQWAEAITDLSKVIDLDPEFVEAYRRRGVIYSKSEQYGLAIENFEQMMIINPDNHESYQHRGNVYLKQAHFDWAMQDFTKALELNPQYPEVFNKRGDLYRETGQYDKAIADYTKTLSFYQDYVHGYLKRGQLYYLTNQYKNALLDLRFVLIRNPKNKNAQAMINKIDALSEDLLNANP